MGEGGVGWGGGVYDTTAKEIGGPGRNDCFEEKSAGAGGWQPEALKGGTILYHTGKIQL